MRASLERHVYRDRCESSHVDFTCRFFKARTGSKFRVNWHHVLIGDVLQDVIDGKVKNVIFNVAPGSSKTELVVINLIARGLAINPRSRFLHLSYSDDLALLNSQTARDIIDSEEYQELWPLKIAPDTKSKKRWNVIVNGKKAGGVYATTLGGAVTGFRGGQMETGFTGAIIVDDPLKPEDAFSKVKLDQANRKLASTVQSRRANPDVPVIIIMQRISLNDSTGFILGGAIGGDWKHVVIPAVLDETYVDTLSDKYKRMLERDAETRFSYWPYKERISELLNMERGGSDRTDQSGNRLSRHVFASQYQQNPIALGGNIIHGEHFHKYDKLPRILFRKIFVDTAQKTKERNDYSVFQCWGIGDDGKIYILDQIRGKWEAPELESRARAFWSKHAEQDTARYGQLREMVVEDKASGTGLIQKIQFLNCLPVRGIERNKDKLTRVMDIVGYIESRMVAIPESASFTSEFVSECEAFTADDTHDYDDQIDPMCDACVDMLGIGNEMSVWAKLGQ